jgi:hypothetical protein
MIFRAIPLRFAFETDDAARFAPGKAMNAFRGALGMVLPENVFSPRSGGTGPSGFENRPRPFVLRSVALTGQRLSVEMNAFDIDAAVALEAAAGQIRALRLIKAVRQPEVEVDLTRVVPIRSIQVRFVTPMELKFEGSTLREPHFPALFARARDRVSSLCADAPDADYRGLGERSRSVVMTESRIEQVEAERRSSRTGQRHGLGGFTGEAEYAGELSEFLPWLKAAEWTGVGRYTVWGNGALVVTGIA